MLSKESQAGSSTESLKANIGDKDNKADKRVDVESSFQMNFEIHECLVPTDVVFLHGNLASNRWWLPALKVWQETANPALQGRLIFAEWRGCGGTQGPEDESELAPERLARDYIDLLNQLGVKKANLVGHSTGGLIALSAMAQEPDLFDRAFLLDPVAADGVQFEPPMYDAFTQMSQSREFCALVMAGTIHNLQNDSNIGVNSELFKGIVDDAFGVAKGIWHGVPNALRKTDLTALLPQIHHPVLVAHGEFDTVLPIEKSKLMAQQLPSGRFIELKGQGHSTNVENPKFFVQLVNEFLFNKAQ